VSKERNLPETSNWTLFSYFQPFRKGNHIMRSSGDVAPSVFPDRLQIQIASPLRPTHAPPLSLVPSSKHHPKTVGSKDHASRSGQLYTAPSLLRITTIDAIRLFVRRSFEPSNFFSFESRFFGIGRVWDCLERRDAG